MGRKDYIMKLITILLLLFSFTANAQLKQDKHLHISAGVMLSSSAYTIGQFSKREMNLVAPSLIAISGAAGKEFFDVMNGRTFSYSDFAFTAISGIITNIAIRLIWKPKKKKQYNNFEDFPLAKKNNLPGGNK